ncbi:MAG: hypothetical protein FDZ70_10470, partial [Actinobacteria bacterium]
FPGYHAIEDVAADGQVVTVTLSESFGAAADSLFPFVLPGHLLEAQAGQINAALWASPIGCGPYRLERWEDGVRWQLRRADSPARAQASIERLDVVFTDDADAMAIVAKAEVPTLWAYVDGKDAFAVRRDGIGTVVDSPTGRWWGLLFNTSDSPFADPLVRKALIAAYPTDVISASVLTTAATPFTGRIFAASKPPTSPVTADPEVAKAALARAGWRDTNGDGVLDKDGEPLQVVLELTSRDGSDEALKEEIDAVLEAWRRVGVATRYKYNSIRMYGSWLRGGRIATEPFGVVFGAFPGTPDPGWGSVFDASDKPSMARPWGIGVAGGADGAEMTQLHREASTEPDARVRASIGSSIQAQAVEQSLILPERPQVRSTVVNGISGYRPGAYPAGDFWNVAEWSVPE